MLACKPSPHLPFHDLEQYFGRSQKIHPCTPSIRTPLLEVQNNYSPRLQDDLMHAMSRKTMQPSSENFYRFDDYPSTQVEGEQHAIAQDSGLGISTDENMFTNSYLISDGSTSNLPLYRDQDSGADSTTMPKLESPFEDQSYTPAVNWNGTYPCSTLSDGLPSAFGVDQNSNFLQPHNGMMSGRYTMSPVNFTPNHIVFEPVHYEQFERPINRHDSSASAVPPTSIHSYHTPSIEASPFQWTPQSTTPDWHNASHYHTDSSQIPQVMLDYSACDDLDQNTYTVYPQQRARAAMTVPLRRKPHLRPSLSESSVHRMSSPARIRAASMGHFLQARPYDQYSGNNSGQQLPLPPLPPSVLIGTLQPSNTHKTSLGTPTHGYRGDRSNTNTPLRRKRPSSPPPSDFTSSNMPYQAPIRQEPMFPGDLYTPRYKRRSPNGRWEGWCGYCQPGRWLDLKNSRFWEDKLRNHGICAKTKMRFEEPEEIRWVNAAGSLLSDNGSGHQNDPFLDQRKREGLCGVCKQWIGMDGLRTKARDRAVGWWMHAYKCHDHDKAVEEQPQTS